MLSLCRIAGAATLAGLVSLPLQGIAPGWVAAGQAPKYCPFILAEGTFSCYRPWRAGAAKSGFVVRLLTPGPVVRGQTGLRLHSIEVVWAPIRPFPNSPPAKKMQIYFIWGRLKMIPLLSCPPKPRFVFVVESVGSKGSARVISSRRQSCWRLAATWKRRHVTLGVHGNVPLSELLHIEHALYRRGVRQGL